MIDRRGFAGGKKKGHTIKNVVLYNAEKRGKDPEEGGRVHKFERNRKKRVARYAGGKQNSERIALIAKGEGTLFWFKHRRKKLISEKTSLSTVEGKDNKKKRLDHSGKKVSAEDETQWEKRSFRVDREAVKFGHEIREGRNHRFDKKKKHPLRILREKKREYTQVKV